MKAVVYTHLKGFRLSSGHLAKIKAAANVAVVQPQSDEEFYSHLADAEILVCGNYDFRQEWLDKARKLKYLHSIAAGVEKILPLLSKNILLANAKGVHAINIAEQVLGYMIMHERKLDVAYRAQLQKKWIVGELALGMPNTPGELFGKTAIIFGLGNIGKRIAAVCRCMGMKVIAVKRDATAADNVDKVVAASDFKAALKEADYAISALPYTKETHHLFSKETFSAMKSSAFFINIGRGSVVDENALTEALKSKQIGGAALDVFETEPLPETSELWSMESAIITPHSAGFTTKYVDRFVDIFCENLKAYVKGERLPNLVDREKGY